MSSEDPIKNSQLQSNQMFALIKAICKNHQERVRAIRRNHNRCFFLSLTLRNS